MTAQITFCYGKFDCDVDGLCMPWTPSLVTHPLTGPPSLPEQQCDNNMKMKEGKKKKNRWTNATMSLIENTDFYKVYDNERKTKHKLTTR